MARKSKEQTNEVPTNTTRGSKAIVVTVGDYTYLNTDGECINHNRPTLVRKTSFVEEKVSDGMMKLLAVGLPDTVSDIEWREFYNECKNDTALAVASFCAKFGLQPNGAISEIEPVA